MEFEESRLPFLVRTALISLKVHIEQMPSSPEQEGILPADALGLELQPQLLPGGPACQPTLQILGLPASMMV